MTGSFEDFPSNRSSRPRSDLPAVLRRIGYDIDLLRKSWPKPPGPPNAIFDQSQTDEAIKTSIEAAFSQYVKDWRNASASSIGDLSYFDLITGNLFHGVGWGFASFGAQGWVRHFGHDNRATLLLRVPEASTVYVWLCSASPWRDLKFLYASVRYHRIEPELASLSRGIQSIRFRVGREIVADAKGILEMIFTIRSGSDNSSVMAFTKLGIHVSINWPASSISPVLSGRCRRD